MLLLIMFLIAIALSFVYLYFFEYLHSGIIYWSIPIVFIISFLIAFCLIVIVLYIITLFVKPKKKIGKPKKFYTTVIKYCAEFVKMIFHIKLDLRGLEKMPQENFLFVSNHQSNMDPVLEVWAFNKYKLAFIMKESIMKVPVLGRCLYGGGFLPLDRQHNRKALITISTAIDKIKNNYHPMAVYPEGTRSKGPKIGEFRNGVFKIAEKSHCPIVIVITDNGYKVKNHFPFRSTKVLIEVVDVLYYNDYKDLHTNQLGAIIHQKMAETLELRRKELPYLQKK